MKTCKKCGSEVEDENSFCPNCGGELEEKKLTYMEKREAKEKEKQFLLSKASISKEDIQKAGEYNSDKIFFQEKGSIKASLNYSLFKLIVEVVVFVMAIIWAKVIIDKSLDGNIKLLIIFTIFIVCAVMVALFISDLNYYLTLNRMKKSKIAVKKIKYGENPIVYYNGKIYELSLTDTCPICNYKLHIEETDEMFLAVCGRNRDHLFKLDMQDICQKCIEKFKDNL